MATNNNYGTRLAHALTVLCFLPGVTEEVDQPTNNVIVSCFSGATHERSDRTTTLLTTGQNQENPWHTTTPDLHHYGPSSFSHALIDRMRWRWRDRWRPNRHGGSWWRIHTTGRSHRVSRMERGSRPFSYCLFRSLRTSIAKPIW